MVLFEYPLEIAVEQAHNTYYSHLGMFGWAQVTHIGSQALCTVESVPDSTYLLFQLY